MRDKREIPSREREEGRGGDSWKKEKKNWRRTRRKQKEEGGERER